MAWQLTDAYKRELDKLIVASRRNGPQTNARRLSSKQILGSDRLFELTETLTPGDSAEACDLKWDAEQESYVKDESSTFTVYDTFSQFRGCKAGDAGGDYPDGSRGAARRGPSGNWEIQWMQPHATMLVCTASEDFDAEDESVAVSGATPTSPPGGILTTGDVTSLANNGMSGSLGDILYGYWDELGDDWRLGGAGGDTLLWVEPAYVVDLFYAGDTVTCLIERTSEEVEADDWFLTPGQYLPPGYKVTIAKYGDGNWKIIAGNDPSPDSVTFAIDGTLPPPYAVLQSTFSLEMGGWCILSATTYSAGPPNKTILLNGNESESTVTYPRGYLAMHKPAWALCGSNVVGGDTLGPVSGSYVLSKGYPGFKAVGSAVSMGGGYYRCRVLREHGPTICTGKVYNAFESDASTFEVKSVVALSGLCPVANSSTSLTIQNAIANGGFGWSGENDAVVRFQYNPVSNNWLPIAIQPTKKTVYTDFQYDSTGHKVQVKTTEVGVLSAEDESDWTDKITLQVVDPVTNVTLDGLNFNYASSMIIVFESINLPPVTWHIGTTC